MEPPIGSRPHMRTLIRGLLVLFVVLGPALGASAHAVLVETDPPDGARLEQIPEQVALRFSEPVSVPEGAVRVFDASGRRVEAGEARPGDSDEEVVVDLDAPAEGTYVVAWRVVSLDGHPIRGAFVFGVGDGDAVVDEAVIEEILGPGGGRLADAAVRWITYGSGLVAAGAAMFGAFVLGRARGVPAIRSIVRGAAVTCVVASAITVPVFAQEAQATLREALASSVGLAAVLRVAAMAVLFAAAGRNSVPPVTAGVALVAAAELATGHTRTTEPLFVVMAADTVHVLGAAFWLGGLAALAVAWRRSAGDDDGAAALVGRFSAVALWTVLALGAAGVAMAWIQVGGWRELATTDYGLVLSAKVAAVAAVLAVAAYNNRVLVPRVASGRPGAGERLRSTVRIEVAGLAIVVALTAVLVDLPPAAEAAGPYSNRLEFGENRLELVVDPNRAGANQVHVYVLTAAGVPADTEGEAVLEFHFPAQDIGPIVRRPIQAAPGHWVHTGPELAVGGEWHVTFRLGEGFEATAATAVVRVGD